MRLILCFSIYEAGDNKSFKFEQILKVALAADSFTKPLLIYFYVIDFY